MALDINKKIVQAIFEQLVVPNRAAWLVEQICSSSVNNASGK